MGDLAHAGGRPADPRPESGSAPGRGENRPAPSLVNKTKESTRPRPDLRLRHDDVGRGFLYLPMVSEGCVTPEPCTGPRSTSRLSRRAVRQLKGAAIKAVNIGQPLRTFITFTVRLEDRGAFLSGARVLGKEMKRTINALNEWLRRRRVGLLIYVWAAENVRDENPHVHMLTSYAVPRAEFDAFARHLEGLWGWGFAKIERVKKPDSAGRYLMKALGYTMKGADDDQGTVIGNRYGIARDILPKYQTFDLNGFGAAAEGLRARQAEMTEELEELAEGLWLTPYGLSFQAGTTLGDVAEVLWALTGEELRFALARCRGG